MSEEIIRMSIRVDSSDAKKAKDDVDGLAASGKNVDSTYQSVTRTIKNFAGALAIGATFRAVTNATIEQERVTRQLEAVLQSTGGAAGYAKQELLDMASELQKVTTFGDEAIISAQTRLLSYSGIVGTQFPRALQNVLDQSARLNISLEQSAEVIGKALENPLKAAASLSRQGFAAAFTEEVEATIEALVKAGREADAQALIMDILEESYGGAAKAARDTLGGALTSLKNAFGDLLEGDSGGEGVKGAKDSIEDLIRVLEDPNTKQAFGVIVQGVTDIISVMASGMVMFANFGRATGELLATRFGTQLGLHDIDGLVAKATKLQDQLDMMRERGDTGTGMYKQVEAEFERISAQLEQAYILRDLLGSKPLVDPENAPVIERVAGSVKLLTAEEIAAAKAAEELAKARQKQLEGINRQVAALQLEADTLGMTRAEIELYRLSLENALPAQMAAADAALRRIEIAEAEAAALADQAIAAQAYHALMQEMETASGIAEIDRLMAKHAERQEIIRAALDAEYITRHEHDLRMMELDEQTNAAREQIMRDFTAKQAQAAVDTMASVLSITTTQVNQMAGLFDQASGIGKAFFIASKALAAANAVIAGLQASMAIRVAYAQMAAMSGPAAPGVLAAGEVHANVAKTMGMVTGGMILGQALASFDGGGFTGFGARSGGVDGKGGFYAVMHPNETVIDHTKGQSVAPVVNLYEDASRAGQTQSSVVDGKTMIDVFVANIRENGAAAKTMQQAFGLKRAGR